MSALRAAADTLEIGTPFFDESDVRSELTNPDADPAVDMLLAFTPSGELVGSAWVWADVGFKRIELTNYVHPDWMEHGIGSMLIEWSEARAKEMATAAPAGERVVARHWAWSTAEPAKRFFAHHGYAPIRYFNTMEIVMSEPPPTPAWPESITVREMVVGQDEPSLYEADCDAFQDHWGFTPDTFASWVHDVVGGDKFDASLHFLAMDGDQIAGFSLCAEGRADNPDGGWVNVLGVRPPWRRRGMALALLHHSFGELYRRGRMRVILGVDSENPTGAMALYERAGMHATRPGIVFEKELVPAAMR